MTELFLFQQGQCHFNKMFIGATQAGIVNIPPGSEMDLQAATATAGPISVAVDGTSSAFRVNHALGKSSHHNLNRPSAMVYLKMLTWNVLVGVVLCWGCV